MNGSSAGVYQSAVCCSPTTNVFVSIGYSPISSPVNLAYYATSTNGSTWTTPAPIPNSSNYTTVAPHLAVNPSGTFMMVGCQGGGQGFTVYSTSADGSTWSNMAPTNGTTGAGSFVSAYVAASSNFFVMCNEPGNTTGIVPWYQTYNGTTWSANTNFSTNWFPASLTASSTGKFVAMGYDTNANTFPRSSYATAT
jgi:hypothetical protein